MKFYAVHATLLSNIQHNTGISEYSYGKLGDRNSTWWYTKCKSDKHSIVCKPTFTPPSSATVVDLDAVWAKMIDISAVMETMN